MKPDTRTPMVAFDFAALALVRNQDWSQAQKEDIYRAFLEPRCRVIEGSPGTLLSEVEQAIADYTSNVIGPETFAGRLFALGASRLGESIIEQMTGFEPPFETDLDEARSRHMRLLTEG